MPNPVVNKPITSQATTTRRAPQTRSQTTSRSQPVDRTTIGGSRPEAAGPNTALLRGLRENYGSTGGERKETIQQHQERIQGLYERMQAGELSPQDFQGQLKDFYAHSLEWHRDQRNQFEDDWSQRQNRYGDRARDIRDIVNIKDDASRNLNITQKYGELSQEMRELMGKDSGANWSTWATWASKQAGQTIRQEDLGSVGKMAKAAADALPDFTKYIAPPKAAAETYDRSSAKVAHGNRKVFEEIAPHFARFAETFRGDTEPNAEKLRRFQEGFRPGGLNQGGQDLLKDAFTHYHEAMFEKDRDKKKELMFLANGQIGLHEQTRLQPEIAGALPWGSRELATDRLMTLGLPDSSGRVQPVPLGDDVPRFQGRSAPRELRNFQVPEARNLVNRWDKNPRSVNGSGAQDWTSIPDRMNFIIDLFRSRHNDSSLFADPFSPGQTRLIKAGHVPGGPL